MAHSVVHLAAGVVTATAAAAPGLVRRFRARTPLALPILRWLAGSYALGLWALIPSFLHHAGIPAAFCDGWWMNLFLCHAWLGRARAGTIIAAAALLGCCLLQYGVVLMALWWTQRRRPQG